MFSDCLYFLIWESQQEHFTGRPKFVSGVLDGIVEIFCTQKNVINS